MTEKEFEEYFASLVKQVDFAAGTDKFREELLVRCLAVLNDGEETRELEDSELRLLSAAGPDVPPVSPDVFDPMKPDG